MLDSKFFFTLVGLIIAVFAVCNTNISSSANEGFTMVPRTVKVMREVSPKGSCGGYSLQNNYQAMLGSDKFVSRPNFNGILSPRFSNVDYGANIKYNMPSYKNLGAPCDPLAMGDMAQENYQDTREDFGCSKGRCGGGCGSNCGGTRCGKGGVSLGGSVSRMAPQGPSEDSNYINAMNQIYDSDHTEHVTDGLVPVGDMTTINADGQQIQQIIYDRYIYANLGSNLRAQGDPIRGDLAIAPCNNGWFNVSVNPNIDLQEGALNVLGGSRNETTQALGELIYATSGGADQIVAGVPLNMSNQFSTTMSAAGGDINVSAFP